MSMIFTKIQFENSSAPSEISGGEEPVYEVDGKIFLRTGDSEVEIEEEEAIFLDEAIAI